MNSNVTVAVAGESIFARRLSVHSEERFLEVLKVIRSADVAFTHLETIIHDYDGPEVYPTALSGNSWMRSPRFVADELKWVGFHMVSLAHNHVLDYSYGGLFSTWEALNAAGIVHAGTGRNLGEAREPAYLDTPKGRVALISMCSANTYSARAGEARRDVKGRPGLNPLRFHWVADAPTIEGLKQLAFKVGWHFARAGKAWLFYPPGSAHLVFKFIEGDKPGVYTEVEEDDAEGNLRAIRDAARQADYVLVHVHAHDWDPERGQHFPPKFVPPFAKACIDAGAHIYLGDGREPLKGIEIHRGRPIFYGRGGFIGHRRTITGFPADFYVHPGYAPEVRDWRATLADAMDAREALPSPLNPPGGSGASKVEGSLIGLCSIGENGTLTELKVYPLTMVRHPRSAYGTPLTVDAEMAKKMIDFVAEISAPYGTTIEYRDGVGVVKL